MRNRYAKKDTIKWAIVAIALLLVAAAVVGLGLQMFGKGKQKPSEWFKKPDTQIEQVADETTDSSAIAAINVEVETA